MSDIINQISSLDIAFLSLFLSCVSGFFIFIFFIWKKLTNKIENVYTKDETKQTFCSREDMLRDVIIPLRELNCRVTAIDNNLNKILEISAK